MLSVVAILAGVRYFSWRFGTLDGTGPLGVAFLAVELISFVGLVMISLVLLRSRWRAGPSEPPGGTLDIFITVCGEPVEMVERTLVAAKAISYPHRTYILNDGAIARKPGWEEIDALAARHGVTCLTRTTGGRGKAANLNHALAHTDGEFIATIDADHIAHDDLADQTLGYLADGDVAFVCSLQSFSSDDHDTLNNEERFFYRSLQPAKDADGCAMSCGNGTVYRRAALDSVGGFSEWNLVEDLHTSYLLHAKGWRSVYHPRALTHGTAPLTAAEYLNQRLQWATDSLRILLFDNPLRRRGLSWRHRLHYFHTTSSYLFNACQAAFIVAPSLYLLWGVSVVDAPSVSTYISYSAPFLLALALFLVAHTGVRGAIRTVQSALFASPVYLFAIVRATTGIRFRSRVTNKDRQKRFSVLMLPQAIGFVLAGASIVQTLGGGPRYSVIALFWCGYVGFQLAAPLLALTERQLVTSSARQIVRFGVVSLALPALFVGPIDSSPTGRTALAMPASSDATEAAAPLWRTRVPSATSSPKLFELEPPEQGAYFGVANPNLLSAPTAVDEWTAEHGHRPQIVQWFQQWGSNETRFRGDWLDLVTAQGAVPMITWEPWAKPPGAYADPDQPGARLELMVNGTYDDYIDTWAEGAATYGRPVIIRFMQEMNGWWYPWSITENGNTPELFVQAWRHVHDRFVQAGAHNVSWVWSMNAAGGEGVAEIDPARFYPGPEFVDWVSYSGFNWGAAEEWSTWKSADEILRSTYDTLAAFGKPIMISEIGTVPMGGDEAAWIRDAMAGFARDYPLLKAVVWFDTPYEGEIDFSLVGASAAAMSDAVAAPHWSASPVIVSLEPTITRRGPN
ncbi:MAG: glycosyltransferase [Acidimicrobiales bacterium]